MRLDVVVESRQCFQFSYIHCTQPPPQGVTKLLCPHHEGAGYPHPIRVRGPDLWYQMALVDTTVEQSLVSSAGGTRGVSACGVRRGSREGARVGWRGGRGKEESGVGGRRGRGGKTTAGERRGGGGDAPAKQQGQARSDAGRRPAECSRW